MPASNKINALDSAADLASSNPNSPAVQRLVAQRLKAEQTLIEQANQAAHDAKKLSKKARKERIALWRKDKKRKAALRKTPGADIALQKLAEEEALRFEARRKQVDAAYAALVSAQQAVLTAENEVIELDIAYQTAQQEVSTQTARLANFQAKVKTIQQSLAAADVTLITLGARRTETLEKTPLPTYEASASARRELEEMIDFANSMVSSARYGVTATSAGSKHETPFVQKQFFHRRYGDLIDCLKEEYEVSSDRQALARALTEARRAIISITPALAKAGEQVNVIGSRYREAIARLSAARYQEDSASTAYDRLKTIVKKEASGVCYHGALWCTLFKEPTTTAPRPSPSTGRSLAEERANLVSSFLRNTPG